jgi:preprotein translocase subunit YajC
MWFAILLAQTPAAPEGGAPIWYQFMPIVFVLLILYLMIIRPQRTQEKQRLDMVAKVKRNDKIVNSGGIIGIVDSVKDEEVVLKGGLRITRSSIVRVVDEGTKES